MQGLCLASRIIIRKSPYLLPPSFHHSLSPPPLPSPSTFLLQRFKNCRHGMLGWLGHWIRYSVPASNSPLYLITFFPRRSRAYYSATSFFFFQFTFRLQNFVHHGDGTLCATLKELAAQIWHLNSRWFTLIFSFLTDSYQDTHTQSFIMVTASGRWFGVRLDAIISLVIGLVVLVVVLVSQDAGM